MSFSPRLTRRFPKHLGIWFTYCVQISSKKKVSRKIYLLPHCIVYHPLFPWSVCVSDLCNLFIQALDDSLKRGLKNWDIINTLKEFSSPPPSHLPSAAPLTTTRIFKGKRRRNEDALFPMTATGAYLVLDKCSPLPPQPTTIFFLIPLNVS